jgi:hypothetical protein
LVITALVLPFLKFTDRAGESFINRFNNIFFESNRKYLFRLLFITIMGGMFIIFAAPTHFLGDGYLQISNLAMKSGITHKWSEKGITLILEQIQYIIGAKNEQTATASFQVISYLAGMISIYFYFLIAEIIWRKSFIRILVFLALLLSGTSLLFFGYIESYPLIWISLTGFTYTGLRYMIKGRGWLFPLLFLGFGIFIHLQMAVLIPVYIYLIFSTDWGLAVFNRFRSLLIGTAIILLIGGIAVFFYKYQTDLYFENIFLPPFSGKPIDPGYYVFSMSHLVDILNQMLLLSPLLPVWLLFLTGSPTKISKNKILIFLSLIAFFCLLFVFFIDPKLGMPRDWDLFSFSAFGLTLLLISMTGENHFIVIKRLLPSLIIFLTVACLPYFLTNLNRDTSIKYVEYMIRLDPKKSLSSLVIMRGYYNNIGEQQTADSLTALCIERFPNEKKIYDAFAALRRGDINRAEKITETIIPEKFSGDYHNFLSALYLSQGDYNKALKESDKAIQLKNYNYRIYVNPQ